ncbi:MAG: hypothetical protein ACLGH8_10130 [Bacteroidia bacterium]
MQNVSGLRVFIGNFKIDYQYLKPMTRYIIELYAKENIDILPGTPNVDGVIIATLLQQLKDRKIIYQGAISDHGELFDNQADDIDVLSESAIFYEIRLNVDENAIEPEDGGTSMLEYLFDALALRALVVTNFFAREQEPFKKQIVAIREE